MERLPTNADVARYLEEVSRLYSTAGGAANARTSAQYNDASKGVYRMNYNIGEMNYNDIAAIAGVDEAAADAIFHYLRGGEARSIVQLRSSLNTTSRRSAGEPSSGHNKGLVDFLRKRSAELKASRKEGAALAVSKAASTIDSFQYEVKSGSSLLSYRGIGKYIAGIVDEYLGVAPAEEATPTLQPTPAPSTSRTSPQQSYDKGGLNDDLADHILTVSEKVKDERGRAGLRRTSELIRRLDYKVTSASQLSGIKGIGSSTIDIARKYFSSTLPNYSSTVQPEHTETLSPVRRSSAERHLYDTPFLSSNAVDAIRQKGYSLKDALDDLELSVYDKALLYWSKYIVEPTVNELHELTNVIASRLNTDTYKITTKVTDTYLVQLGGVSLGELSYHMPYCIMITLEDYDEGSSLIIFKANADGPAILVLVHN